jgi:predicted dienelactone hydrolase
MNLILGCSQVGLLASLVVGSIDSGQQAPSLWGTLRPGPHAVGFRSAWELDYGRVYNTTFTDKTTYASGKAPRPILINIWYPATKPADPKPMRHRDYLAIESGDARLTRFASQLIDYERAVVCKEVMGKKTEKLTRMDPRLLDEFWNTPTASLRDAPPIDGKFPLVVYHAGAGSSFEDNSVLCEFLASHGYVVAGSAFQEQSGRSFNIDVKQGSSRDIEFLIAHARRLPYVDWNHIGLMGHSAGAQAALIYRSLGASPVDALVSFDTTQDYSSLDTEGWEYLTKPVLEDSENMTGALLMVANAHAFFQLADSLKDADRYYLTVNKQSHNDFISQGIVHRILESRADSQKEEFRASLASARAGYEAICESVLEFFDACLKNEPRDRASLLKAYRSTKLGGPVPHMEHVPTGMTGPEPFRDDGKTAPTPRQVRPLLAARGLEPAIAVLKRYHSIDPTAVIFQEEFGYVLIDEALERKRVSDALLLYRLYLACGRNISKFYAWHGDLHRRYHSINGAKGDYNKALLLDPGNDQAIQGLRALEALKEKTTKE